MKKMKWQTVFIGHGVTALDLCPLLDEAFVPKRAAIIRADQYMIKTSDYLIAYDCGLAGNTKNLVVLARRREKRGMLHIENLADRI